MAKKILHGPEVLQTMLRGVNRIADPVGDSLGPNGRNCVYERVSTNQPISSRDGVTISNQIDADDPFEAIGVELIKGVAREAVDQSGDGTTTATILAQAIFAEGVKSVSVGANPVAVKRGIEKAAVAVVDRLRRMAVPLADGMLEQVATISANNDPFLGGLIATAMTRAGDDGVVTVEISRKPESSLEIVDGLQFAAGYLAPEFVTSPERNECVLEDCYIFLHEKKLATILPMRDLLTALAKDGKSFLVIAEDVTDEALAVLALSAKNGKLRCCAVRTPGGPDHLFDIGALTGGQVMTALTGTKLNDVPLTFLGHAKRAVVKSQSTTVYGDGENPMLHQRLAELRTQVKEATDSSVQLRLQARLARLAGGIAVIRVGGMTEVEMWERKDRIEDAMHATRCAKMEGVLPGGGMALFRAAEPLRGYPYDAASPDESRGVEAVKTACSAPIRRLAQNSGRSPDYIMERVLPLTEEGGHGWDARSDKFCDLVTAGILDPLRVVRVALESAASVSGLMLITSTLVSNGR